MLYPFVDLFISSSLLIFLYMSLWFIVALIYKRNDVADIAWGIGFIAVAVAVYINQGYVFDRSFVVTLLVVIWGSRLSYHILKRNKLKPEDKRYAVWRVEWGKWFIIRSYLQVFILQGVLMLLISIPIIIINTYRNSTWTWFDVVGVCVWLVGFYFESVGDKQLRSFISNPSNKGKILDTGLWKYTRHPNYFGEVTQWWGLWIIALSVPYGIIGIIGPLTISFLILKVSGVPMLEKSMMSNPFFDEYRKKTSVFFPLPVRKI